MPPPEPERDPSMAGLWALMGLFGLLMTAYGGWILWRAAQGHRFSTGDRQLGVLTLTAGLVTLAVFVVFVVKQAGLSRKDKP